MPLHLRPVGPLPDSVYWRRRAAVVAVLVLLLALLTRVGGDAPPERALSQASAAPSPSAAVLASPSASPGASPPASPAAAGACPDAVLRVQATPAQGRYARGARPVLRLAVRNAGGTPCTRPLGQAAVELLVYSGADRIWSSDDCAPGGQPGPVVLRPQELRVITLTWSGRRSRPGCPDRAEQIEPGTYRVLGRVGSLRADGTSFLVV